MSDDRKNPYPDLGPIYHNSHPRPRTRRQFLAQGFLSGAATVMSPSLLGFLGKHGGEAAAQAMDCGLAVGGAGKIPFMCFDLAGGANIAGGNILAGQQGGWQQLLTLQGYERMGLQAEITPQQSVVPVANEEMGLPFHFDSAFLRGILSRTTAATRAACNGTLICARSSNDTQNNPHNPLYGIARAGSAGGLVTLIGTDTTESGGNSIAPMNMIDPAFRPVKIDRPSDATGMVDTGRLVQVMDDEGAAAVMDAIERMSNRKISKMQMTEEAIVTDIMRCAYEQSTDLVAQYSSPAALDPRADPLIIGDLPTPIFTPTEIDDDRDFRKTASVMKLVVQGHAGAGCVELGSYDYHGGTRTRGEGRDFAAGQCVGAALEYANRTNQDLMLYVFSDGSLSSDGQIDNNVTPIPKPAWQSDNSSTAAVFILVHGKDGVRPTLVDPGKAQLGYFRPDGSVETNATEVSNSPERLAEAIVLNYLALHGEVNRFNEVLPMAAIGNAAPLADLIAFNPMRTPVIP